MSRSLAEWAELIEKARRVVYTIAHPTPVVLVEDDQPAFADGKVFLKLEHLQKTGSFKLRGATNKILSLLDPDAARGVITSSTGNHALGVAAAAKYRGIDAEVVVSTQVSSKKRAMIEAWGARITKAGANPLDAELAARSAAVNSGRTYVPPYNDAQVVAGQGTIAAELLEQAPHLDAVYVAVGGGGLIGGIGAYLKAKRPQAEIIGCWPQNSPVMYECLQQGRIVEVPEFSTISESTAGGVESGSITFELCQQVIDTKILVSEAEALTAMRWAHRKGWPVEGSAAVAIAACVQDASRMTGKTVAIVSCGANASPEILRQL